jgi:hypothetical protein
MKKMNKIQDPRSRTIRFAQLALIIFVWVVLLMTPVLFREANDRPLMNSVMNQLEILIPLSILYLVNRFVLVPFLLFRRKTMLFLVSVLGVILLLAFGSYIFYSTIRQYPPRREITQRENLDIDRPPPPSRPGEPPRPGPPQPSQQQQQQPKPVPPYANFLILSVLLVGFDTGLLSGLRWINVESEKVRLEKENVDSQLTLLRNQVSPHFFMNTLNNIHALIDTDTNEAKEAVIKLSKMMRYLLYETDTEKVTLKKEVEFLQSYIDLMKLRYSEKVTITLNLPDAIPDTMIPPFLFTSFIENAFKHGISYRNESFVTVDLIPGKERLLFVIKNSKSEQTRADSFSGIGLENARKRLALLFGIHYHLDIIDTENLFTVNLSIPI